MGLQGLNIHVKIVMLILEREHMKVFFFFCTEKLIFIDISNAKANRVNRGTRLPTNYAKFFFDLSAAYKYQIL
jgi:hypothetical protein